MNKVLKVCLCFFLIFLALIIFVPLIWTLSTSFKTPEEITSLPITFFPKNIFNLDNYIYIFAYSAFGRYLLNSFIVSGITVVVSLIVASLAGFGFAKYNFPGKDIVFFAILAILMVPFQAITVPLYLWSIRFKLVDTYQGLAMPGLVSAFGIFLMRGAIESIPNDYLDAARIDGASELRIYWRIILPSVKGSLAALAIIKFLWTWTSFFWPLIITSTDKVKVVTLGLADYTNMYFVEYNFAMAASIISIIPLMVIFIFFQKWVVKAMVLSGMKG